MSAEISPPPVNPHFHSQTLPVQPPLPPNPARYDGDGKRVQKDNGKLYWYGTGSDPLAESDQTSFSTASV